MSLTGRHQDTKVSALGRALRVFVPSCSVAVALLAVGCGEPASLSPARSLSVRPAADGIHVRFTLSPDDGGGLGIVRGYQVLRGRSAKGPFLPFAHGAIETVKRGKKDTPVRQLVDTSALPGVAYHYQVWALPEHETGSASHAGAPPVAALVGPARRPGTPTSPATSPAPVRGVALAAPVEDDGRHVEISFSLSPDDDAGRRVPIAKYVVLRAARPGGPFRPFIDNDAARPGVVDTPLDPVASELRVRALAGILGPRAALDPADRPTLAALVEEGHVRRADAPRATRQDAATRHLQDLVLSQVAGSSPPDPEAARARVVRDTVPGDGPWTYRVYVVPVTGDAVGIGPGRGVSPRTSWFAWSKTNLALVLAAAFALTLFFLRRARTHGKDMYIRRIAGIDALEEAVGRATEMGRPILYVPGIDEIQNIQTIASLLILGRVSELVARYDSQIKVPCCIPIVATVAEEVVRQGFYNAGRPDQHRPQNIQWISSEQFAFCAGTNGIMLRDKPATNIFLGRFFGESLILAETGYVNRAIQIGGTAEITQLPFFIAACDYAIIGEELFAISAYMAREPRLLGSIKAADWIKLGILVLVAAVAVGGLLTWLSAPVEGPFAWIAARSLELVRFLSSGES